MTIHHKFFHQVLNYKLGIFYCRRLMSWSDFSVYLNWYCQQLEVYYKCSKINSDDTIDMTARPVPCCPKQHQSLDTFASTHLYWYTIEMDNEMIIVENLTLILHFLILITEFGNSRNVRDLFTNLRRTHNVAHP